MSKFASLTIIRVTNFATKRKVYRIGVTQNGVLVGEYHEEYKTRAEAASALAKLRLPKPQETK